MAEDVLVAAVDLAEMVCACCGAHAKGHPATLNVWCRAHLAPTLVAVSFLHDGQRHYWTAPWPEMVIARA